MMNKLRRIDMNLLLTLHTLLKEKHISRTAERLYKSQPAISHALAQLRSHFDDPLLVKQQGKFVLSAKAENLLPTLENALSSLNGLLGAETLDLTQPRHFRLAMTDYASSLILPALIQRLRQIAPNTTFSVVQSNSRESVLAGLRDGELDLAFGIFQTLPAELHRQTLFCDQFVCITERKSLNKNQPLDLNEWLTRPHIHLSLYPNANEEIEQLLASQNRKRNIAVSLPHWQSACALLEGTDLLLTIARRIVPELPENLVQFPPPIPLPEVEYQMIWHTRKQNDLTHLWLREEIGECVLPFTAS